MKIKKNCKNVTPWQTTHSQRNCNDTNVVMAFVLYFNFPFGPELIYVLSSLLVCVSFNFFGKLHVIVFKSFHLLHNHRYFGLNVRDQKVKQSVACDNIYYFFDD